MSRRRAAANNVSLAVAGPTWGLTITVGVAALVASLLVSARPALPALQPGEPGCEELSSTGFATLASASLSNDHPDPVSDNDAGRLLAVSPDGAHWASVDRLGLESGPLRIDGSDDLHLAVELPGPLGSSAVAAVFSADGSWLAAIDGYGQLWHIDASTGEVKALPAAPQDKRYDRQLAWGPDGRLLVLLADGGMEISIETYLAAVDLDTGKVEQLSAYPYAGKPMVLADGSIAFVAYVASGTTSVRLIANGKEIELADVGPAGHVDISRDGEFIAFDIGGERVFVMAVGKDPVQVKTGSWPRFGSSHELSVLTEGTTQVIDVAGNVVCDAHTLFSGWVPSTKATK